MYTDNFKNKILFFRGKPDEITQKKGLLTVYQKMWFYSLLKILEIPEVIGNHTRVLLDVFGSWLTLYWDKDLHNDRLFQLSWRMREHGISLPLKYFLKRNVHYYALKVMHIIGILKKHKSWWFCLTLAWCEVNDGFETSCLFEMLSFNNANTTFVLPIGISKIIGDVWSFAWCG